MRPVETPAYGRRRGREILCMRTYEVGPCVVLSQLVDPAPVFEWIMRVTCRDVFAGGGVCADGAEAG